MKRILSFILTLAMLLALMPTYGLTARAADVSYIDEDGDTKSNSTASAVPSSTDPATLGEAGLEKWYTVSGTVTLTKSLTINGNVHIILLDDAELKVTTTDSNAIVVSDSASLSIYAQSTGVNVGKLTVLTNNSNSLNCGIIAGSLNDTHASGSGAITINGGEVNITINHGGAAENYGIATSSGPLAINGGKVTITATATTTGTVTGIYSETGGITIRSPQPDTAITEVDISATCASTSAMGIYPFNCPLTIENAEVTAKATVTTAGDNICYAAGIYASNSGAIIKITGSHADVALEGTFTGTYADSLAAGINSIGSSSVTVDGGTLSAKAIRPGGTDAGIATAIHLSASGSFTAQGGATVDANISLPAGATGPFNGILCGSLNIAGADTTVTVDVSGVTASTGANYGVNAGAVGITDAALSITASRPDSPVVGLTTGSGALTINSGTVSSKASGGTDPLGFTSGVSAKIIGGSVRFFKGDGTDAIGAAGWPKNGESALVYPVTLTFDDSAKSQIVTALAVSGLNYTYGTAGMKTDADGKLCLWLPVGSRTISATVNGTTYKATLTVSSNESNTITALIDLPLAFTKASDAVDYSTGLAPTLPTLNNVSGRTVTYTVADVTGTDVASITSDTGALTINKAGTVTVTASAAEDATYTASSASYTLIIELGVNPATPAKLDEALEAGIDSIGKEIQITNTRTGYQYQLVAEGGSVDDDAWTDGTGGTLIISGLGANTEYTLHLRLAATDCYAAKGDVAAGTLTTGQLAIISGSFDVTGTADLKAGAELSVETASMADEESNSIGSSFTYTWYRSDNNVIDGDTVIGTEATYTLVNADEGKYIYVVVGAAGFIGGQPSTAFGPVPIPTHALTIDLGGGTGGSASGSYAENTVVSINAGMKSGYTFAGWTATAGTLLDATKVQTTFTMPAEAVTLTASWTQNQVPAPNPSPNRDRDPDPEPTTTVPATTVPAIEPAAPKVEAPVPETAAPVIGKLEVPADKPPIVREDGSTELPGGGAITLKEGEAKIDVPAGTVITGAGNIGLPRGSEGARITTSDGAVIEVEPGFIIEILPNGTPLASFGNPFEDVDESDWFFDAVRYAYTRDHIDGTSDRTFSPNLGTSRGMIAAILFSQAGAPAADGGPVFSDVSAEQFYADAVSWAASTGIVVGFSADIYAPDQDITREQLATIIYRYVQAGGGTLTPVRAYVPFADELEASEYAREAIARLYELGILNGKSGERFDPKGLATRGEVAAIIKRLTDILDEMP